MSFPYVDVAEWVLNKCALSSMHTNSVSKESPAVFVEEDQTDNRDNKSESNKGSVA